MRGNYTDEQDFVLELCKLEKADSDKILFFLNKNRNRNLPWILGQLLFNRMGGAAYYTLEKAKVLPSLNREFRDPLKAIYEDNRIRVRSYKKGLEMLACIFQDVSFPYALLKGAYLCSVYPEGVRTSHDYDLLIDRSYLKEVIELFKGLGFVQGIIHNDEFRPATRREIINAQLNRGEIIPFVKEVNLLSMRYIEIDVNFSLTYHGNQKEQNIRVLLENREPAIITEKGNLYTLSIIDFVIHLCFHLYKEAVIYQWVYMGRDLLLYKFCDLFICYEKLLNDNYKNRFIQQVKKSKGEEACYYSLYYMKELFNIQNPLLETILDSIKPKNMDCLRRIYNPENKKCYTFDMDMKEWIFAEDRLSALRELGE